MISRFSTKACEINYVDTPISNFFFYSWHKTTSEQKNSQLKIKAIDHSRNDRDESISHRKLEEKIWENCLWNTAVTETIG